MAISKRKCKWCKEYVSEWVTVPAGTFCTIAHAMEFASQPKERERASQKRVKAKKNAMLDNDRSHWLKKAQAAFNAFIRARDESESCISCGRFHYGQYHAGHYRTVGANPELRFEELNCHKQCSVCNNHLSGNLINYRIGLVAKIGQESVDWLEGPHAAKKYTVADLKQIELTYKQKLKELRE